MAQIGDVLYLKSGSAPMTVLQQTDGGWLLTWFAGAMFNRVELPETLLVNTDPTPAINQARADAVTALAAKATP